MDFKVAGTHKGITSIQMDLKVDGLTPAIIKDAFAKTKKGREYIIDEVILKAIAAPREEVAETAPKMITIQIKPEKIREVIGKGGEVIQKIVAETGAKIDIQDDGTVYIASSDRNGALAAKAQIDAICFEPEVGAIYTGKVTRIIECGAYVEFAPGKEALCHVRNLDTKFVEKVEDVVSVGDEIVVMYTGIDDKGRMNLSRKAALGGGDENEARPARAPREGGNRGPRNGGDRGNRGGDRGPRNGGDRGPRAPREQRENRPAKVEEVKVETPAPVAEPTPAPVVTAESDDKKGGFFSIFKKKD
jgi:polyribonucleotide nucleotidyltransferase